MDMNTLIHHRGGDATTTSSVATTASTSANTSSFRAPATNVSPFPQNPSLPGLRAHLPSLPIRLAALHPSPADHHQPPPRPSASLSSSAAGSGSAPPSSQATSLAPLRFIIPSSHCPPTHGQSNAYTGNATSDHGSTTINIRPAGSIQSHHIKQEPTSANATNVPRSFSDPSLSVQDRQVLHHQHNRPPPLDIALLIASANTANEMDGAASTDGSLTDGKTKKSPGKRNRAVKNPNRSTKSKARPGLRKGKWTEEEERYATQLTNYFKEGLLPIERGTMLRLYLSQKLNCEPMRITKKFTGGECIGKQVFRPCSPTPDTRVRLMQAQLELVALEAAFIKKLKENKEEVPGLTDDVDMSLAPGAIAGSARPKKRRPYHKERKSDGDAGGDDDTRDDGFTSDSSTSSDNTSSAHADGKKTGDNVDDASAVGLLLDFFYKASNKNDENGTAASSKPSSSSASSSSSMPLFPKREVSTATSVASSEPDPELEDEQPYKLANEELANSPTKRMRTLSISQCHTDVTTSPKRSRLGSFTAVTSHP